MSQFFMPLEENFRQQWNGYTLILPCISVGNVPQLSTDLLINQLLNHSDIKQKHSNDENDLKFVGFIRSKHVRPFAGPDAFKMNGCLFSTSIQVFVSKSKKLVIIQQRSPIYKEYREHFYMELSEWLSPHKFSMILLLSSAFDHFLAPEFIDRSQIPVMYLSKNLDDSLKLFVQEKLNIKPVMKMDPYSMKPSEEGKIHLPGSGSARSFLKYLSSKEENVETKILCLVMFCSEGDNRFHAFRLADKIADILNYSNTIIKGIEFENRSLDENEKYQDRYPWTAPFSWRLLFGDEPPSEIY